MIPPHRIIENLFEYKASNGGNHMTVIAISADKGVPISRLEQLSHHTGLPLLSPQVQANYCLHIASEQLELRKIIRTGKKKGKRGKSGDKNGNRNKTESIHIDFVGGKARHRRLHGGGKGQPLAKAVGLHKISHPQVLDLTAGLGEDAFVLASLGASIIMVERNPVVHALLQDALERAHLSADPEILTILTRMTLQANNAFTALDDLTHNTLPDVIYLDPMFPARSKSAQVKKEMQFFHDIVGADNDSEQLLLKSLNKASRRIVVKRPRLAQRLTQQLEPAFVISGKTTRYDVYLPVTDD